MERPTIKIDGEKIEMEQLKGKDWRTLSEFNENQPKYTDADFIERHADFISKFFRITAEEILDKMPLEEILPASRAIQNYTLNLLTEKLSTIEKNSDTDKVQ